MKFLYACRSQFMFLCSMSSVPRGLNSRVRDILYSSNIYSMPLHFLLHLVIIIKFIKTYTLSLAFFLPLKFIRSRILYIRTRASVSQPRKVPLETYTLFLRHSPSCLVRVPVTSLPYCRGGKGLDSREFREKNFLIRVYKRFVSSCTTSQTT